MIINWIRLQGPTSQKQNSFLFDYCRAFFICSLLRSYENGNKQIDKSKSSQVSPWSSFSNLVHVRICWRISRAVHHDPRTQYRSNRKEYRTDRIERLLRFSRKSEKKIIKMPLLGELSRTSLDSFESESDSNKSWDDRLNSPKSGKNKKCHFLAS